MTTQETLISLGLEPKEASIYLAILELGETNVADIAKKSGIKRPTVYVVLRSLESKGFVSRIMRGKKTFFSPQHPRKLITEAEVHLKELSEILPQLESLFHTEKGRPRIMIYEGKEELDRAYDEWFVMKGELAYIGTLKLSSEIFSKTYNKLKYIAQSPEFNLRELIDDIDESRKYSKEVISPHRLVRFLPKEILPFEADIGIFGNRVLITSVKREYFTVSIESEEVAQAFRKIFDIMWGVANE